MEAHREPRRKRKRPKTRRRRPRRRVRSQKVKRKRQLPPKIKKKSWKDLLGNPRKDMKNLKAYPPLARKYSPPLQLLTSLDPCHWVVIETFPWSTLFSPVPPSPPLPPPQTKSASSSFFTIITEAPI
uniref:Uncharacterized protein n=1 Tax=Cacopsylla melanoneura TaxID=428564 RepID=A0A8D8TC29_9HEMI